MQWWWRSARPTDDLALPVWFDDDGPVAAAGLTAWGDTWQVDGFAVPSIANAGDVWAAALAATVGHPDITLRVLGHEHDAQLIDLAVHSGFTMTDEVSGTSWMDADARVADHARRRVRDRRSRDPRRPSASDDRSQR